MKYKKVLLINPANIAHRDSIRRLITPLGLMYVAASLRENGYEVAILDSPCEGYYNSAVQDDYIRYGLSDEDIVKKIKDYKPDMVGVNAMFSAEIKNPVHHCGLVKSVDKDIPVVLGGIGCYFEPEKIITENSIDYIILGEAEERFPALLSALNKNENPNFDGIAYKRNGEVVVKPAVSRISDLNNLPLPARDLIDMKRYLELCVPISPFTRREKAEQIMTSRGCPADCIFCSSVHFWGRKIRTRSVDSILGEVDELVNKYGVEEIQFSDDNLTVDKERAKELFRRLKKYNLAWCTPNGLMAQTIDTEMIKLMAQSGAYQVTFAIESGSPRVLKEIIRKKVPEKEEMKKIIAECHENNMQVHGFFVVGLPGETKEEVHQTFQYPFDADMDSVSFYIAYPLAGSRLRKLCREKGYLDEKSLKNDIKKAEINIPKTSPEFALSKEELEALINEKAKEFAEFSKKKNPAAWDNKFKLFFERHPKDADLILGRVT